MSEATNTKLMDTERGGENTQYESQHTFTQSHAKDQGTFGDSTGPTEATSKAARNTKLAASKRRRILDLERRLVSMGLAEKRLSEAPSGTLDPALK
ncbi:hypothetical protein DID88_005738 [Monilinia fructigena]|uniref:Uncharacterized protein n=1 Tax=Monilinia fructigena TaxID=38457 RepID=A0A395J5Z4_9HELO|nr:hypothetical protein DID88_005738 [Monilinia fructigena]